MWRTTLRSYRVSWLSKVSWPSKRLLFEGSIKWISTGGVKSIQAGLHSKLLIHVSQLNYRYYTWFFMSNSATWKYIKAVSSQAHAKATKTFIRPSMAEQTTRFVWVSCTHDRDNLIKRSNKRSNASFKHLAGSPWCLKSFQVAIFRVDEIFLESFATWMSFY